MRFVEENRDDFEKTEQLARTITPDVKSYPADKSESCFYDFAARKGAVFAGYSDEDESEFINTL